MYNLVRYNPCRVMISGATGSFNSANLLHCALQLGILKGRRQGAISRYCHDDFGHFECNSSTWLQEMGAKKKTVPNRADIKLPIKRAEVTNHLLVVLLL